MDHISDLPDELLHGILSRLRSFPAAVRTSRLSRRWCRVWASVPDITLVSDLIHQGTSFLDMVDAALAAYSADPPVTLRNVKISMPYHNDQAGRVSAWLLFASQRVAGKLDLRVDLAYHKQLPDEIDLPPFKRAMGIALALGAHFHLRLSPVGVFAALVDLNITLATMDARELEVLVSSQCPRLRNLTLMHVTLVNGSDLSISSATLRRLKFHALETRHLDVSAPNLEEVKVRYVADVHVAAPNLAELVLAKIRQFVFADAVGHLRRLEVTQCSAMAPLMRQLDMVDELRLQAPIGEEEFKRFMDDTNNLPKCDSLSVSSYPHRTLPSVLHLLRRVSSIKKLVILLSHPTDPCSLACACRSPHSAMAHDITLESLENIEFHLFRRGEEYVEILKHLLSIPTVRKLKSVSVHVSCAHHPASLRNKISNKVRRMCPPNITVEVKCIFICEV
ncbi:hypothetical protein ACQ4PT_034535 [Festuca glaucescens]